MGSWAPGVADLLQDIGGREMGWTLGSAPMAGCQRTYLWLSLTLMRTWQLRRSGGTSPVLQPRSIARFRHPGRGEF